MSTFSFDTIPSVELWISSVDELVKFNDIGDIDNTVYKTRMSELLHQLPLLYIPMNSFKQFHESVNEYMMYFKSKGDKIHDIFLLVTYLGLEVTKNLLLAHRQFKDYLLTKFTEEQMDARREYVTKIADSHPSFELV